VSNEWGPLQYDGYPFISLLSDLDRSFVFACIGMTDPKLQEKGIREFRGHAWVLSQYAELVRHHERTLDTIVSLGLKWTPALEESSLRDSLLQYQRRLVASSGTPVIS
jgi:hypothetical protein